MLSSNVVVPLEQIIRSLGPFTIGSHRWSHTMLDLWQSVTRWSQNSWRTCTFMKTHYQLCIAILIDPTSSLLSSIWNTLQTHMKILPSSSRRTWVSEMSLPQSFLCSSILEQRPRQVLNICRLICHQSYETRSNDSIQEWQMNSAKKKCMHLSSVDFLEKDQQMLPGWSVFFLWGYYTNLPVYRALISPTFELLYSMVLLKSLAHIGRGPGRLAMTILLMLLPSYLLNHAILTMRKRNGSENCREMHHGWSASACFK